MAEISPGILLHKKAQANGDVQMIIENQKANILEITVDVSGSQGVRIKEAQGMVRTVQINPLKNGILATLITQGKWVLKTRFQMKLKPMDQKEAMKLIGSEQEQLTERIQQTSYHYRRQINYNYIVENRQQYIEDNFIDPYFPPTLLSILLGSKENKLPAIQWRRPYEFFSGNFEMFLNEIEPNDIKQGQLGDCWFMCALASLAERPSLVERLFTNTKISKKGVYKVWFCKSGEWESIIVDDYFPCFPRGGPIFSRSQGNELWVLLLEKAYAKLHGSYMLLRGGWAAEGMMDLTGCPTSNFDFQQDSVQKQIFNGEFWNLLKQVDEQGALISASTPGEDRWTEQGGANKKGGLVPGHAYTVIQVIEAKGNKLLNIRNPWGSFEWDGDWSDNSSLWTKEMRELVNPILDDNDGTFWMNFDDFVQNFSGVNICYAHNFQEARLKGVFEKIETQDFTITMSKWVYSLHSKNDTRVFIGVHQDDERMYGVTETRPNLDMSIAVFQVENQQIQLHSFKEATNDRQAELQINIKGGKEYIILPYSSGCALNMPEGSPLKPIKLTKAGQIHPLFRSVLQDVFRKFNKFIGEDLSYSEFFVLFQQVGIFITEQRYQKLMEHLSNNQEGIVFEGFEEFIREMIDRYGEQPIRKWLRIWGYNELLFSDTSRVFVLTTHSDERLQIEMRQSKTEMDLNRQFAKIIATTYGEVISSRAGVKLYRLTQKSANLFLFGALNENDYQVLVELNCSRSQGVVFHNNRQITQRKVEPGQFVTIVACQIGKYAESCRLTPIMRATRYESF